MAVGIDADVTPVLSYAMAHNSIAFLSNVRLQNDSGERDGAELRVEVCDSEGVVSVPWVRSVDLVQGGMISVQDVQVRLDASAMLQVDEQRPADLVITITHDETVLGRRAFPVQLLAAQQWLREPELLSTELLAAFVMPNHPAIAVLLAQASDILRSRTGSGALEGYQSGGARADEIAGAIFDAMQARRIRYSNPPASWADDGQKVRTADQVLDERVGTCLDTTVVMAAAYEQAGLRPLLWLVTGHIFLGYWRAEHQLPETVATDIRSIVNLVDLDRIRLVETTMVNEGDGPVPFSETHRPPYVSWLAGDLGHVLAVVDIVTARESHIFPLPARTRDAAGAVEVTEYRPNELSLAPAATAARERESGTSATLQPAPPRVQRWKNALLDLSLRNKLINFEKHGVRLFAPDGHLAALEDSVNADTSLELLPSDAFDDVVKARGVRTAADLPQSFLAHALSERRSLYTDASKESYAARLHGLAYKARTIIEESGANNLYLALGTLVWPVDGQKEPLHSPLILVPVRLRARARRSTYQLRLDDSGASTPNYCLLEKLRQLHGLEIPDFAEPAEDGSGIDLDAVLGAVRGAIADAGLPFRVEETAHLAILQFAKFRLWKDLDESWEAFTTNPLVRHLVETPTDPFEDPAAQPEDVDLDELAGSCPVPADATQLTAISEAVAGRTFVLEGPPGTGKSQTITNLLSRCLGEGRRVLFVAEKRAALDVVRDRLDAIGLAPFSLDLHDKGSRPVAVRAQIKAALEHHVEVDQEGLSARREDLGSSRRTLARYAQRVHAPNGAGLSLYGARSSLLAVDGGDDDGAPVLTIPPSLLEAGGTDRIAALRTAMADLPDTADPARPSRTHAWGFITRTAATVDVDATWSAARDLDAAADDLPSRGALSRAVAAARLPSELRAVATLASRGAPPLDDLDETRTGTWRRDATSALDAAATFAATPLPRLQLVVQGVLDLPLASLATQAHDAAASSFIGRKKRLQEVHRQLAPRLRSDATIDLKELPSLLDDLARIQTEVESLRGRLAALPGVKLPAGWDPLLPDDRELAQDQMRWLTAAGKAVDPATSTGRALRDHVTGDGASREGPGSASLGRLADASERLAAATGSSDDDLSEWTGDGGLVDHWRSTAGSRALADDHRRSLRSHLAFLTALEPLLAAGLAEAHRQLRLGAVPAEEAVRALDRGVARASLVERRESTGLDGFEPHAHRRALQRFADSSRAVRKLMEAELPRQVIAARPFDVRSARGRIGELHHEVSKQRRGLGVRALMTRYGDLVSQVMPCVLVSPDSLARFFPAKAGLFDVVVFDEASQIRVADAVGAMGRARSVVVVGDSQQMPPTSFGESSPGQDEDEADEEFTVVEDQQSILDECVLARVPRHWLSWHYRSQDESLIAFSNRNYYRDRLSSFPAPPSSTVVEGDERGISLVRVEGRFHRSGAGRQLRTNPVEADAVVREVRRRFAASPDETPSIGIVTFNVQQRTHIDRVLRDLHDERITAALDTREEGLFVKNLENVQGDERDTILFSTAFSTNDKGVLPLNFGPLNRAGGERRLNVAVTRARRQVIVFSSFDPSQLRAEDTTAKGVKHLRAYLDVAAHGPAALGQGERRLAVVDRHRDDIASRLRERGLVVQTDVGLSDFKIDLSVALPHDPGSPRLAVLLDGPGWASRRTVGDRDGLPVEVLSRMLRWPSVERVWLPAWLDAPDAVLDALEQSARAEPPAPAAAQTGTTAPPPAGVLPDMSSRSTDPTDAVQLLGLTATEGDLFTDAAADPRLADDGADTSDAPDDQEARTAPSGQRPPRPVGTVPGESVFVPWEPGALGDRSALDTLSQAWAQRLVRQALEAAVTAEGPIQEERLARLVAGAFGLGRVSEARRRSILDQLPRTLRERTIDGFVWPLGTDQQTWTGFRRPSAGEGRSLEHVSLREIGNAMWALCASSGGMSRSEVLREALAVFGGRRMTTSITVRLDAAADEAIDSGRLVPGDRQDLSACAVETSAPGNEASDEDDAEAADADGPDPLADFFATIDHLAVTVDRSWVERGDVSEVLTTLTQVLDRPDLARLLRGQVQLAFAGYDDDPREVFEIAEIREYVQRLNSIFPYWLYFAALRPGTLTVLLYCLIPQPRFENGHVIISRRAAAEVLHDSWFPALNQLAEHLDEEHLLPGLTTEVSRLMGLE